ncbi:hypothetical protein [Micromonospora humida]|uniref:Uncharacterized protein n=1 Tax=Micromonospora humida TaxID=2809018 RepID=A0ABS2IVL8_9ACTN|nr:hypothetical protein [Micromonospora humida]MBM7078099.1 hypothetical protein [Micromonospora humida]
MTRSRNGLTPQARQFADTLQALLNRTVCDHARIGAKITPEQAVVGTRLEALTSTPVRMRSAGDTNIWIDVQCYLSLDGDEGRFLTVQGSVCGLYLGDDPPDLLLHYDFEREKDRYTEAHIQVCAAHPTLERLLAELGRKPTNGLQKIHLPVGGRRFRPALEDLLECLIVEGLVRPKPGWQEVLDRTRIDYRRKQIAAVVRRNTGTAQAELERLGYQVVPPDDQRLRAQIARLIARKPRRDDN